MSIDFACGNCGRAYSVKAEFAGKSIRCKACESPMKVPAGGGAATDDDEFFDTLADVIDGAAGVSALPPRSGIEANSEAKVKQRKGRQSGFAGFSIPDYVFGGCLVVAAILAGLMLRRDGGFFAFYLFFSGICLAAAWSKAERRERWIVPGTGTVAGYAVMMLFAAVITRNTDLMIGLLLIGLGLGVFVATRGILGVALLAGLSFLQVMYFAGAFKEIDVVLMDQSIRRCHLLANLICVICLISGYLYHVWSEHVSQRTFDE
jgi:hypothetical protein